MKTLFSRMSDDEIREIKMSMFPRKYHGPELKCSGPGMCPDCTDRVKNGIPFDFESPSLNSITDLLSRPNPSDEKVLECTCGPRVLFWKGCVCGYMKAKKEQK